MSITGEQVRRARHPLGWTQRGVADKSRVGVTTVKKMEAGVSQPKLFYILAVQHALEAAGVAFANGGELGVMLRKTE